MRLQPLSRPLVGRSLAQVLIAATFGLAAMTQWSNLAYAAISWDAGSNSQYWFDPVNWSNNVLPPSNGATPPAVTDTDIGIGTASLPGGEGIVYDPSAGDPNFANIGSQTFPDGFNAQTIQQLYVARALAATKVDGVATPTQCLRLRATLPPRETSFSGVQAISVTLPPMRRSFKKVAILP